jgi:hypothetical protein
MSHSKRTYQNIIFEKGKNAHEVNIIPIIDKIIK